MSVLRHGWPNVRHPDTTAGLQASEVHAIVQPAQELRRRVKLLRELLQRRLVAEALQLRLLVHIVRDRHERSLHVLFRDRVLDERGGLTRFRRQRAKGLLVECAAFRGRDVARALIPPERNGRVPSPAPIQCTDRELQAIEIHLRLQHRRP